ncbi:YcaO-like family protein [Actinosynnema sp. NPDC059797]
MTTPSAALLRRAVGWRQGVVSRLAPVPRTLSDVDVPGYAAVPEPFATGGTSGGAAFDAEQAELAAVAEALERHAAARTRLRTTTTPPPNHWPLDDFSLHTPAQRAHPDFRHRYDDPEYAEAWTLPGNEPVWVPAGLVALREDFGLPATSSGLAAGPSPTNALLRALQELVERDAFTTTWLHGLAPPRLDLPADLRRAGDVHAFDLTPARSPHPVVAVAGTLPLAGRPRPTLGLACRATLDEAVRKAWLEWTQGTVFIATRPTPVLRPDEVTDFDRHALYYAAHPDEWHDLPWWRGGPGDPPPDSTARTTADQLRELVDALGVRLAYRDLTTPELAAVGLTCVRVLSPDLTPLHADHRWPHLGGRTPDASWRYPGRSGRFPNPAPHPLG